MKRLTVLALALGILSTLGCTPVLAWGGDTPGGEQTWPTPPYKTLYVRNGGGGILYYTTPSGYYARNVGVIPNARAVYYKNTNGAVRRYQAPRGYSVEVAWTEEVCQREAFWRWHCEEIQRSEQILGP